MGVKPSDAEISAILSEIDVTYHGQLELQDYLQVETDCTRTRDLCRTMVS